MVIDKINSINNIPNNKNNNPSKKINDKHTLQSDSFSISKEAAKAQDASKVLNIVKNTSDIRQERVNEVKAKLARGEYDKIDHEILDKVAEKIAMALIRS